MLSLGHTVISELVVTNVFMHSLLGMILLYLATSYFTLKVFLRQMCIPYIANFSRWKSFAVAKLISIRWKTFMVGR